MDAKRIAEIRELAQEYQRSNWQPVNASDLIALCDLAAEAPESWAEPEMCPNCVTPWKCNGPHEFPQAASSEAAVAITGTAASANLAFNCMNGETDYWITVHTDGLATALSGKRVRITPEEAHPAPTTADAGVTDKLVDVVYTAINRLGTPISQATVQAALEAALARAGVK